MIETTGIPAYVIGQDGQGTEVDNFWKAKIDLYTKILPEIFLAARNAEKKDDPENGSEMLRFGLVVPLLAYLLR